MGWKAKFDTPHPQGDVVPPGPPSDHQASPPLAFWGRLGLRCRWFSEFSEFGAFGLKVLYSGLGQQISRSFCCD